MRKAEKNNELDQADVDDLETDEPEIDNSKSAPEDRAENGPYDVAEVPSMRPYIDMGGLKIAPREGLKVRLDVDEKSKRIVAISLDYEGSTLQLQAYSAPKSTGLWNELRVKLLEGLAEQKAKVEEVDALLGREVRATPPDGDAARSIRFVGVDGPRWMLRGIIVGPAALGGEQSAGIESVFREVVVVRGEVPMPPSELLPLKVPAGLQTPGGDQDQVEQ